MYSQDLSHPALLLQLLAVACCKWHVARSLFVLAMLLLVPSRAFATLHRLHHRNGQWLHTRDTGLRWPCYELV